LRSAGLKLSLKPGFIIEEIKMGSKNTSLKVVLLATAAGLSFAAPASAADMLLKAPPQPIAVTNWSGWYIGALVGYGSQSSYCNSAAPGAGGIADTDEGCNNSSREGGTVVSRGRGAVAGVDIGIDWQNRNFVYGIAADWTWAAMKGKAVVGNSGSASYKAKIDWLASFRGRMGLAVENTMVYVTAGVAFAGVKHSYLCCFDGTDTGSSKKTAVGWVAGVGVEHRWSRNWSVKGEYLHYDFGNYTATANVNDTSSAFDHSHTVDVFRIGLTYRP